MNKNTRRDDETTDLPGSGIQETQDLSAGDTRGDAGPFDEQNLPVQLGRYQITQLLGRGGMGAVYLARDQQLERDVALKVPKFKAGDNDRATKRFYREARAAATLSHPNLCPIFDVAEIDGIHCIAMAYIKGRSLSEYIDPKKQPNAKAAATIIQKVALAMEEAHQHGILHRDLKPANIMIDHRKEPIVMDFGLACPSDAGEETRLTQDGALIGSPAYMSPEQLKGDPDQIGPASDQYALGVVLYELLCGSLPYAYASSTLTLLTNILTEPPRPLSSLRVDLDERLLRIVERSMAKKPTERFKSMKAFASELAKYVRDMPTGESTRLQTRTIASPVNSAAVTANAPAKKTIAASNENPFENLPPAPAVSPAVATAFQQPASRPQKRSGNSSAGKMPLLISAIAGACLLALIGAGAWFVWSDSNPASPETNSAPAIAPEIVSDAETNLNEQRETLPTDQSTPGYRGDRPRTRNDQRSFANRLLAAFDANDDRVLEPSEIPPPELEEIMVSDTNEDGKLDLAELDQIPPRPMPGIAPRDGFRDGPRQNARQRPGSRPGLEEPFDGTRGEGGQRSEGPRGGGRTGPGRRGATEGN